VPAVLRRTQEGSTHPCSACGKHVAHVVSGCALALHTLQKCSHPCSYTVEQQQKTLTAEEHRQHTLEDTSHINNSRNRSFVSSQQRWVRARVLTSGPAGARELYAQPTSNNRTQ
jgi:hypothetical protein